MKTTAHKRPGPPPMLPSLEAQTVAFVERARSSGRRHTDARLQWGGFNAYLRYWRDCNYYGEGVSGEVLVIAKVGIPLRLQRRGWFWRYCQLCSALVGDALVLEQVVNDELWAALRGHPEFEEVVPRTFVLRKKNSRDWPFKVDVPPPINK